MLLDSKVDTSGKVVLAEVEKFSTVAIFGEMIASPVEPGDELEEKKPEGELLRIFGYILLLLLASLAKSEGPLTVEDWALLEQVKLLGRSIARLDGIEQAVNLRELNLRRNEISDLAPLPALENLERLNLADNKISDLSALNGAVLSPLRHFDLSINEIDDLSALDWDRLENLSHLDICFNYIRLQDEETADLFRNLAARGVESLAEPMY